MISAVIIDMNRTSWTQMAMAMATSVTTVRQWQIPGKRSIAKKVKTGDMDFSSFIELMCTCLKCSRTKLEIYVQGGDNPSKLVDYSHFEVSQVIQRFCSFQRVTATVSLFGKLETV